MGVYSELAKDEEKYIENIYSIKIKDIKYMDAGILNSNFLLDTQNGKYILRIFEAIRSIEEEEQELRLLEQIINFMPVPKILKNKNNVYITEYRGKKFALFEYIEGESLKEINQELLRELAAYLAKFHNFSKNYSFEKFNRKSRIDLDFYLSEIKKSKIEFEGKEKIFSLAKEIEKINFENLPKGIIHSDIFPDNVIIRSNHINGFIDFNESYYAPFIYDIAIVINFWIKIRNFDFQKENNYIRDFLNSYSRHKLLKKEEIKLLSAACKKMALTFIALRIYKEKIEKSYKKAIEIEKKSYLELMALLD